MLTLKYFADKMHAVLINADGHENSEIKGITTVENASEGDIAFVSSDKYAEKARACKASFLITPMNITITEKPCVQMKEIWKGISWLMNHFYPQQEPDGKVHPSAVINSNVKLGHNVTIGPYAVIEDGAIIETNTIIGAYCYIGKDVKIGANCLLHPRVTVMSRSVIGNRVILHPGAVIGSDGFKYEVIEGRIAKIPQVGIVILEDEVEIGANTTIDRASLTETKVGAFTKIDNLVQIAHNVVIGKGCLIVAQVGIAGSTKIGNGCIFGGQVGMADNIQICDGVTLAGRAGVPGNINKPGQYIGAPAMPAREGAKVLMSQHMVPELIKKVRKMEKEIEELKK